MKFALLIAAFGVSVWGQAPGLETGELPAKWITGGPNCLEVPDWQVHEYNPTFYILRESGCTHYEKPFLYLIFGKERALLVDTGAGKADTAGEIRALMARWAEKNQRPVPPLVVTHSHGHSDHTAGDTGLEKLDGVTVIPAQVEALQTAFGIADWPNGAGSIDLGDRMVDVVPLPGHQPAQAAYYDRKTGILLTGDHLYPGRLYVADFPAYLASTKRLVEFTATRPVAHILGCHIEQSATPFVDYPVGTKFQPQEHSLELGRGVLLELLAGLEAMQGTPERRYFRDFTIWPKPAKPLSAR